MDVDYPEPPCYLGEKFTCTFDHSPPPLSPLCLIVTNRLELGSRGMGESHFIYYLPNFGERRGGCVIAPHDLGLCVCVCACMVCVCVSACARAPCAGIVVIFGVLTRARVS